jgi:hypothetical protein
MKTTKLATVTIDGMTREYQVIGRPGEWEWQPAGTVDARDVFNWTTEGGTRPTLTHLRLQCACSSPGDIAHRFCNKHERGLIVAKWNK